MPRKLIAIAGLPGSSKTYYGKALAQKLGYDYIDDPKGAEDVISCSNPIGCVISHPYFCLENIRQNVEKMLSKSFQIEWVYFENDPVQCLKNSDARLLDHPERNVRKTIEHLTRNYIIPTDAKTIPVWRG